MLILIEKLEILNISRIELDSDEQLIWSYRFSEENKGIFKVKNKYYRTIEKKSSCKECIFNKQKECQENYIIEEKRKEIYYACSFTSNYIFIEVTDKRKILIESLNENVFEIKLLKIRE